MESIGEKLRTTRESRNLSLEQVARETHIAKRYLDALEQENFALFPGEPYLIGFLRNYSEFLGLNPQDMVSLYKNLKLQEQPVPMDELLEKRRPRVPLVAGVSVLAIAILGLVLYLVLGNRAGSGAPSATAAPAVASTAAAASTASSGNTAGNQFTFAGGMTERPFRRGDAIIVRLKNKEYRVLLTDIGSTVTLSTPTGVVDIAPGTEKVLDLTGDGKADVRLFVRSISTDQSPATAVVRLDSSVQSDSGIATTTDSTTQSAANDAATATAAPNQSGAAGTATNVPAQQQTAQPQVAASQSGATNQTQDASVGTTQATSTSSAVSGAAQPRVAAATPDTGAQTGGGTSGSTTTAQSSTAAAGTTAAANASVITTASQRRAFTVDFTFKTGAMFRYTVDGSEKQERFFDAGERLTATAETQFQLWLSNAGAAVVTVAGNAITLGASGQVATDIIRWNGPTATGDYRLELVPVF